MASHSCGFGIISLLRFLKEEKTFIVYCKANGSTTTVWFSNNQMRHVSCNIGKIEKQCPYNYLFRFHKSRLVNIHSITMIDYKFNLICLGYGEMHQISIKALKYIDERLLKEGYEIIQKNSYSRITFHAKMLLSYCVNQLLGYWVIGLLVIGLIILSFYHSIILSFNNSINHSLIQYIFFLLLTTYYLYNAYLPHPVSEVLTPLSIWRGGRGNVIKLRKRYYPERI